MCMHNCSTVHKWRSEKNLKKSVLFYHMDLRDQTQVTRFEIKHLYLLSHLSVHSSILKIHRVTTVFIMTLRISTLSISNFLGYSGFSELSDKFYNKLLNFYTYIKNRTMLNLYIDLGKISSCIVSSFHEYGIYSTYLKVFFKQFFLVLKNIGFSFFVYYLWISKQMLV